MELAKAYNPQEAQSKWLAFWDERGYFHSKPDSRKPFTIVIPPPNVTGALHMGHALNNTLQDVLIRWRRMQGYNALWMPGTDHAGIATQAVVERLILQTEKKTRRDLGREELVKRIWAWKDKYEARILGQLKQLGASCDWERTRFTLDPICARAVRETFFKMFKDGLIFRGKRLVNWDTQLQTSVADDETYAEDTKSGFWTFKYPVKNTNEFIRFSTTRPETMLGDTAVCVHPSDERYKHLIGKLVTIPLVNRDIPIIADGLLADPTLGTGCVKVTPAHDPNDYACFQRNPQIGIINILNPDGTINESGGKYKGIDRYKARDAVVADMEALGLFEGKEERVIPLKYSDRSKTPIEPYLSDQWFVRMGDQGRARKEAAAAAPLPNGRDSATGAKLQDAGCASENDIRKAIAENARLKSVNLTDMTIPPAIIELVPESIARENVVIPLSQEEGMLQIVISDPSDFETVTKLQFILKKDIQPVLAPKEQIIGAINRHYGQIQGLARMAMEAVENGHVRFFPERYKNSYLDWLAEKRDWCISRQLWWGHRIPVWTLTFRPDADPASREWQDWMRLYERVVQQPGRMTSHPDHPYAVIRMSPGPSEHEITYQICVAPGHEDYEKSLEESGHLQDPDVLDTWFSSMLWPHSTLGWPAKTPELAYYYPTSVLVTTRDIITLWVARMVIAGLYNVDQVPFHHVYITVKLMDGFGETMSKSKGNGVDPLDIIERYGADALRFLIMQISTETQDARLPVANVCPHCDVLVPVKQEHMYMRTRKVTCPNCKQPFRPGGPWPTDDPDLRTAKQASERFEIGRNFANKIWNAARFILMNLDGYTPHAIKREELPLEDRWILSRLAATAQAVTDQLEGYHFSEAARSLYDFIWSEFCDWYLEMAKGRLKGVDAAREGEAPDEPSERQELPGLTAQQEPRPPGGDRATVQRVLIGVLDAIVRLVQPIMPFVAESIWSALNEPTFERGLPNPEPATESVVIAAWPEFPAEWRDEAMEASMERMQELVRSVREVRNRYNIEQKKPVDVFVRCNNTVTGEFAKLKVFIIQLAGVGSLACGKDVTKPAHAASHVTPEFEVYVSLQGLIDSAAEIKRLDKQLGDKKKQLQGAQAKLENANFVKNAPPEVVEQQKSSVAELHKQIATIEGNIKDLQQ